MKSLRQTSAAAGAIAALTVTTLVAIAPTSATGARPSAPPDQAPPLLTGLDGQRHSITLITGDQVSLTPDGRGSYDVDAVAVRRADGSTPDIDVTNMGEGSRALYTIPDDAWPLINSGVVDEQVFNVKYLAENGYEADHTPLIIEYAAGARGAKGLSARANGIPAVDDAAPLVSIDAAGVQVDTARSAHFWASLTRKAPQKSRSGGPLTLTDDIERVWLDEMVSVALDESVPQIGAPEAWAAGLDGDGVTVAVLDTGIDADHPDVADRIAASRSFIDGQEVADGHGHGTHVASTVAGSGAASNGANKGVAPAADLVIGKVLDDAGSGPTSSIVAGMEWATIDRDVDIVSMSLGSQSASDGTDPMSQAVNQLTEQTGALFVVAAGNAGDGAGTIAAPGAADSALTIGAVDKQDKIAAFSSRGPRVVDMAMKPDVTAPGVDIVAARAAGTAMGTPVDDRYTAANGTSMATPHAAGAVAILVQQHPDWSPQQLKSALVATSVDGGYSVYEQGAGRIDVGRATTQQVQVSPSSADFGFHRQPVEGGPVSKTLTYSNPTVEPVTLTLSATAAGDEPLADGVLTLGQDSVTVPAGGTASATLTFDHTQIDADTYSGSVVATDEASGTRLTTPVGLVLGEQLHKLTVKVRHSGNPPGVGIYNSVQIAAIDSPEPVFRSVRLNGDATKERVGQVFVPPGIYTVVPSRVEWLDPVNGQKQIAYLFEPEVEVTGDTEVVIDAADAQPVSIDTPMPSEPFGYMFGYQRWVPDIVEAGGYYYSKGTIGGQDNVAMERNLWVSPTDEVTTGDLMFSSQWTNIPPPVTMALDGAEPIDLQAAYGVRDFPQLEVYFGAVDVSAPTVNGQSAEQSPGPQLTIGEPATLSVTVANGGPSGVAPTVLDVSATSALGDLTCGSTILHSDESTTCTVKATAAKRGGASVPVVVRGRVEGPGDQPVADVTVAHYWAGTGAPPANSTGLSVSDIRAGGEPAAILRGPQLPAGSTQPVTVVARNSGTEPLTDLTGPDGLDCAVKTLAPQQFTTCMHQVDVNAGPHADPITVTARGPGDATIAGASVAFYRGLTGLDQPMFSDNQTLPLVDAGTGSTEELAGIDASGAVVMVRRDPEALGDPRDVSACWPAQEAIDRAVDAGAAAIVVTANETPGRPDAPLTACGVPGIEHDGYIAVPKVYIPFTAAEKARAELVDGPATVTLSGTREASYVYRLKFYERGRIPASLAYRVTDDDLAQIDHEFHASQPERQTVGMAAWKPYEFAIQGATAETLPAESQLTFKQAPWRLTEYVGPIDDATGFMHSVARFGQTAGRQIRYGTFDTADRRTIPWFDSPLVPAITPAAELPRGAWGSIYPMLCAGCRAGNTFWPQLRSTASSDPSQVGEAHMVGQLYGDTSVRLYQDEKEILPTPDPYVGGYSAYELSAESATYRLTHAIDGTDTEWQFTSDKVTTDTVSSPYLCTGSYFETILGREPTNTPCRAEPLIFLRYDLGLDLTNRVRSRGAHKFAVTAYRQSSDSAPPVAGMKVWTSSDDGQSWQAAKIRAKGNGDFEVTALHRQKRGLHSDHISLKVEAWDSADNRVEQTIVNAYRVGR